MDFRHLVICTSLILAAAPCFAQNTPPSTEIPLVTQTSQSATPAAASDNAAMRRWRAAPAVALYLPSSTTVRNQFGNEWVSLGIGIGRYYSTPARGTFNVDLTVLSSVDGSNSTLLVPVGVRYRKALNRNRRVRPYFAAAADVVPSAIQDIPNNVQYGLRTGYGCGLFTGMDLGRTCRIEAGYRWFTSIASYNFSGASCSLGLRF